MSDASNTPSGLPAKLPKPPSTAKRQTKEEKLDQVGEAILSLGKIAPTLKPPRIVLNAVEGWGKTSCAAFAPEPAILMAQGETGYETLLGAGLVPQVDTAYATAWQPLLDLLDKMAGVESPSHKVLALDALGGFERLCHAHVCHRDYDDDWGEKGFTSYQKGYETSLHDWLQLLARLDRVRERGVTILMLGHIQIRPFKNPMGEDFDRYVSNVHHKTWGLTHKWADAVLFGRFDAVIDEKGSRPKGIGGTDRALYTQHRDAFDAKNRYGMGYRVKVPNDPAKIWSTIWDAITAKKKEGD